MKRLIAVIDLRSTRIAAVTAEISKESGISFLAFENFYSRGINEGEITDMNRAIEDISSIMRKLRHKDSKRIKHVFVTTKGPRIEMHLSRGIIPLSKTPREITKKDVKKCLEIAAIVKLPLDRAVVQSAVRGFYVDGEGTGMKNPVGLYGMKLEVESFIVTANRSKIQNIMKCIDHAGFLLDGIYLSSIASASSVLEPKEKEDGVLLLDIGDALTEALIFKNGMLKNVGSAKKGVSAIIDKNKHVNRARRIELLSEVLAGIPREDGDFSSIVATGEGALLDGTIEDAERIFKTPARMGIVKNMTQRGLGPEDAIIHTSTTGLVNDIASEYKTSRLNATNPVSRAFRKVLDIYESYF